MHHEFHQEWKKTEVEVVGKILHECKNAKFKDFKLPNTKTILLDLLPQRNFLLIVSIVAYINENIKYINYKKK